MKSVTSQNRSDVSAMSQQIIQHVAAKTFSKISSLQGIFNDQEVRVAWNGLGLYISKNLKMGRAINVHKLGIFTFSAPELNLKGVTNPNIRNQKPRVPVFIVSKDFVKGKDLKTGIFYHQQFGAGLRPYAVFGVNGQIPQTKVNYTEIGAYANMDKNKQQNIQVKNVTKQNDYNQNENIQMEIPNVGVFRVRNGIVGVSFNEYLLRDTRTVSTLPINFKKQKGQMILTKDNLRRLADVTQMKRTLKNNNVLDIDQNAKSYLASQMGVFVNDLNNTNMRRTITNIDKQAAKRQFSTQAINKKMISSTFDKLRASGIGLMKHDSIDRSIRLQFNFGHKLLIQWIRQNSFNAQQVYFYYQSFLFFGKLAKGYCNHNTILKQDQIWKGCKQINQDITQQQAHQLYRLLDYNKDGIVNYKDWIIVIQQTGNAYLYNIISLVNKKRMKWKELLQKMGLIPTQKKANLIQVKNGLMKLNPNLLQNDSIKSAKFLMKNKDYINLEQIKDAFHIDDDQVISKKILIDKKWLDNFLRRFKRHILSMGQSTDILAKKFRDLDLYQIGYISQTSFKNVLTKYNFPYTITQMIKLLKSIQINQNNDLNYNQFLQKLYEVDQDLEVIQEQNIQNIFQKLHQFMQSNINDIQFPISVNTFASIIQSKFYPKYSEKNIIQEVKIIDIDGDGVINKDDAQTFLNRKMYMTKKENGVNFSTTLKPILYPKQNLSPYVLQQTLKQLKQKIYGKKYSFYDFFNLLDQKKNGIITIDQWNASLGKLIKLDQKISDGLFCYLDKSQNGMIDYKSFLDQMNNKKQYNHAYQKFQWVQNTIFHIQTWFRQSELTSQDAFKIIDKDFDGKINQNDLTFFLTNVLKIPSKQITIVRIKRLFKTLDMYKRGIISLVQFKRILDQRVQHDMTITGGSFHNKKSTNDWFLNAKQQIGLVISRNFSTITEAFNNISQFKGQITLDRFQKWINQSRALFGFMINQKLIKNIFAELDFHKKGYLNQNDFYNAFGGYNWKQQMLRQVIDYIRAHFLNIKQAFLYFCQFKSNEITKQLFIKIIKQIFGTRFTNGDINHLWNQAAGSNMFINFEKFDSIFSANKFEYKDPFKFQYPRDDWEYQSYNIIKGTVPRTFQNYYTQNQRLDQQCSKIVKQIRQLLRTSPKTLQEVFQEIDFKNNGKVTNLQFKNAFRLLNIALTSKQIDIILNYCDFNPQTLINWKQFIKKFNERYSQLISINQKRISQRVYQKINKINQYLHYHLISPKDAYRKYNKKTTGFMNFKQFYFMIKDAFQIAKQPLPQHIIIKDIFNFIDVRKDGVLDFQQFVQVFRQYQPPSIIQGHTNNSKKKIQYKQSIRLQPLPNFQQSKDFQDAIRFFGKNRKCLQQYFQKQSQKGTGQLYYQKVINIIKKLAKQCKFPLNETIIKQLISFAQVQSIVDYKMLLEIFKERLDKINQFPKIKSF